MEQHWLPSTIRVDNGPEFTSKRLDQWACLNGVELDFSRPGKPTDYAFIKAFNGRFPQECLNEIRSVLEIVRPSWPFARRSRLIRKHGHLRRNSRCNMPKRVELWPKAPTWLLQATSHHSWLPSLKPPTSAKNSAARGFEIGAGPDEFKGTWELVYLPNILTEATATIL